MAVEFALQEDYLFLCVKYGRPRGHETCAHLRSRRSNILNMRLTRDTTRTVFKSDSEDEALVRNPISSIRNTLRFNTALPILHPVRLTYHNVRIVLSYSEP